MFNVEELKAFVKDGFVESCSCVKCKTLSMVLDKIDELQKKAIQS